MKRFKVGDLVRVLDGSKIKDYSCNWTYGMSKLVGKIYRVSKVRWDGKGYILDGAPPYTFDERGLKFAKPKTIVIYRNGDKTVALDKTTGKKAEAKCSKDDEYDFYVGAKIAFDRLIGEDKAKEEPKPKRYSGKVVCIKPRRRYLTKGKIYEFKDGFSKYDNGDRMPLDGDGFTSFKDLEESMCSQFVETVED